ncbi:hypothetical protein COLO4_16212 [Corchorus olitorius]|uniref:Uncharacterized protein n=1 Tax=Corchorus olitorius TaxID=93759 RepID=A0A1R3JIS9_9ROSI|nr:hypothetical protein COLO4_16212 [Corchorus olitorius]
MKVFIFICLLLITGLVGGQNFPGAPNQYPRPPNGVVPGPPLDEHDRSIGMEPAAAFPDQFAGAPEDCVVVGGFAVCGATN